MSKPLDPALPPPRGVIPDFQDPFSLRPYWNMTASLSIVLTSVILILRMYTKIVVVKKCRWEDHMCILGFIFTIVWAAFNFEAITVGTGTHQWNVSMQNLEKQYKLLNYSDIFYSPAVCFTKMSIIFLVLRIFCPKIRDPFYWLLQSLNILNTVFYTVFFFIPIFACQPRQKIWLRKTPGRCLQIFDLYITSAAFNIVSDLAMYSAPFWKIWHLQMTRGRKLGVSAIFATGGLAIIFAFCRLAIMVLLLLREDFSYLRLQGATFALSELASGIFCSCLFVLPRLYRHLTRSPPSDSEEFRLRRFKNLTGRKNLDDPYSHRVHLAEEQRNPWEHDIEIATLPSLPSNHEVEHA